MFSQKCLAIGLIVVMILCLQSCKKAPPDDTADSPYDVENEGSYDTGADYGESTTDEYGVPTDPDERREYLKKKVDEAADELSAQEFDRFEKTRHYQMGKKLFCHQ